LIECSLFFVFEDVAYVPAQFEIARKWLRAYRLGCDARFVSLVTVDMLSPARFGVKINEE